MVLLPVSPAWQRRGVFKKRAKEWGAACVLALVLLFSFEHTRRVSLEERDLTASPDPSAPLSAKDAAENDLQSAGRDALRLWGEWDGLSPVLTQMMAQKPPAAPASVAVPPRGVRGRIRERVEHSRRKQSGGIAGRRLAMPSGDHGGLKVGNDKGESAIQDQLRLTDRRDRRGASHTQQDVPSGKNRTESVQLAYARRQQAADLVVEEAAQSALAADAARDHAEMVADELKAKVQELQEKLKSVTRLEKREAAIADGKEVPRNPVKDNKSWFKRVAGGSKLKGLEMARGANGRKWAAIREEERIANDAERAAEDDHERRIPIGAVAPEHMDAYHKAVGGVAGEAEDETYVAAYGRHESYSLAVPPGQEAYSDKYSSVKAVGPKFPVLSVSRDGTQMRIAAPNDGSFPIGPAKLEVETADGGEALFPYQLVAAVSEFAEHSPIVASGLLFTAPVGGQFPLNSAYVMAAADPAHFPIAWRNPRGTAIKVLAPNDGTFRPGPGAILIKRVGGEEDVYAYQSMRFEEANFKTGPAGMLFTAANATKFPRHGAFAGVGDARMLHLKQNAFSILWRAPDGSEIKVQAPNDGSFNLGPSRFYVRLQGGGITQYPYDSVSVSPADDDGPAGLLFKAPPEVVYPTRATSVEPEGFPEPYPVFGRSNDGQTIYIQAPNDGSFEPGPSQLRLRLANAQVLTFPYSFIAWTPPKDGLPGGLAVTAPKGVHYPDATAYAGPMQGLLRHRSATPRAHKEHWEDTEKPTSHGSDSRCTVVAAPARIKVVEAMSEKAYSTARLCKQQAAYSDKPEMVFRLVPDALIGQTFVRGADSDVDATGANFLAMQLATPSDLFLLWDERGLAKQGGKLPAWVDGSFVDTGALVWLAGGPMAVLRSRMPVSGPVYLGGARAFPGQGAVNNYIVVVAQAGAISRGSGDESGVKESGIQTWVKTPSQSGALDLLVLLYKDERHLVVRTAVNPFPEGRGYLRVTGIDAGPSESSEGQAKVGQLVAYGEVTDVEPGSVGYPGITVTAMGSNAFPSGIRSVEPTVYRIVAVRGGGQQIEVDAPQDGWFPAGPAMLNLILRDGSRASVGYESVGALGAKGWAGLIFTAQEGGAFPSTCLWATPGGPAPSSAEAAQQTRGLSDFPRKDVAVQSMYPVSWQSTKGDEIRIDCPAGAFQPGPGKVLAMRGDSKQSRQHKERVVVEYRRAASVVADGYGPAGVVLLADTKASIPFPQDAAWVAPLTFHVVAVRADGLQMQALSTLSSFPPGPASLRVVRKDGRASAFPYETVVQLPDGLGVVFTAPRGFVYPRDADFVDKISTLKKERVLRRAGIVGDSDEDTSASASAGHISGSTPWLDAHHTGALVITEARATSDRKVAVSVAVPGSALYTDRVAALVRVPLALYGSPLISLSDDDSNSHGVDLLQLRASEPCYVYILRDPRGTAAEGGKEPMWLTSAFSPTAETVQTSMPGMPVMTVYRSKAPLLGPIRLGGNAAFPSRGQRENYAVVLKAARGEGSLSIQGYRLPQDGVFSASHFSPTSSSHDSVAEVAAAGAVDGTLAGTTAAERRYDAQIEVEGKGVAGDVLGDIVQQCEGQDAAKSCLENMHACMAPYKMGDISSCHCFTTSWASGAGWCTDRCKLAVYEAYASEVEAATGFRIGCGLAE